MVNYSVPQFYAFTLLVITTQALKYTLALAYWLLFIHHWKLQEKNSKQDISVDQFINEQNQRQTQIQEKSIFGCITSHLNDQLLF
jgi:hypothetical protein